MPLSLRSPDRSTFGVRSGAVLASLALCCFVIPLAAQMGGLSKGFKLLYYDPTPAKGQTNLLKSEITGAEAQPQPNGPVLVKKARIQDYLEDGRTNLIATAPECFADFKNRIAYSTNRLEVLTADGQLAIQGEGFFYQQTNFDLTISNRVETTIHRELIRSTNVSAASFPSFTRTNAVRTSNQLINIRSDHFFLESASNLAIYSGHVRVADPQLEMACETLTIRRATNGPIERIVAEQNVFVTNHLDNSWAVGERAVYSLQPSNEVVLLTGQQARWQAGDRQALAGKFTFDRQANTLKADQNPSIKLPRSAIAQPDWLAGASARTSNNAAPTNGFVDITAEEVLVQLPTTNRPSRTITAKSNVLILSLADQTRATSERAFYDEGTGKVELLGHAVWQSEQRLVKGETLVLDRSNRVFSARGKAYLRIPISSFAPSVSAPANLQQPALPEIVEVFSDHFIYEPAALSFYENVRANYFQGQGLRGWLTAGLLRLGLTNDNRIESALAKGSVSLVQPLAATNLLRQIDRKLACEALTLHFDTNGLLQSLLADTNVRARQTETRPDRIGPIRTELNASKASLTFFPHTNQLQELVAEGNVSIVQDTKTAHGDKAVYTAGNNSVELIGHPTAETPLGRITEAETLIWDRTHNTLRGRGKKVVGEGEIPERGTNRPSRLLPK